MYPINRHLRRNYMAAALDKIKVVDLTRTLAGPFCTMLMGDMGAEVVKIEEPSNGDETRHWTPFVLSLIHI